MWLSDNGAAPSLMSPERIKRDDFLTQTQAALRGLIDPGTWHGRPGNGAKLWQRQSQCEMDTTLIYMADYDDHCSHDASFTRPPDWCSTCQTLLRGRDCKSNWHVRKYLSVLHVLIAMPLSTVGVVRCCGSGSNSWQCHGGTVDVAVTKEHLFASTNRPCYHSSSRQRTIGFAKQSGSQSGRVRTRCGTAVS